MPGSAWRIRLAVLTLLAASPAAAVLLPVELLRPAQLHIPAAATLHLPAGVRLQGLFSRGQGRGSALLQLADGRTLLVSQGQTLGDGLWVEAVLTDRLVLRHGQQQAVLRLQDSSRHSATTQHSQPLAAGSGQPTLHPSCQRFVASGVPLEELLTLGECPD